MTGNQTTLDDDSSQHPAGSDATGQIRPVTVTRAQNPPGDDATGEIMPATMPRAPNPPGDDATGQLQQATMPRAQDPLGDDEFKMSNASKQNPNRWTMSDTELEWLQEKIGSIINLAWGILALTFPVTFLPQDLKFQGNDKLYEAFLGCNSVCIGLCIIIMIMGVFGGSSFMRSRFGMGLLKFLASSTILFFTLDVDLGLLVTIPKSSLSGFLLPAVILLGLCSAVVALIFVCNVVVNIMCLCQYCWPGVKAGCMEAWQYCWPRVKGGCMKVWQYCWPRVKDGCTKLIETIFFCFQNGRGGDDSESLRESLVV